jgi:hypothetical protein
MAKKLSGKSWTILRQGKREGNYMSLSEYFGAGKKIICLFSYSKERKD